MKQALNTYSQEGISIRAVDRIGDNHSLEWNRRKLPASGESPLACDTGQDIRSTGVRPLVSSKVREAPNCKRAPAIHRWPKWSALCRLLQPDSPSCNSGNFSEKLHIYRSICKSSTNKQEFFLANWQLKWVYLQDLKYKANHILDLIFCL